MTITLFVTMKWQPASQSWMSEMSEYPCMLGMTCPFVVLDGRPGMSKWHVCVDDNVHPSGRCTERGL